MFATDYVRAHPFYFPGVPNVWGSASLGQAAVGYGDETTYARGLAEAVNETLGLYDAGYSDFMTPLFECNAAGLGTVLTQATGLGIGELCSAVGIGADIARIVVNVISAIMQRLVDFLGEILKDILDIVGDICEIIPIIGAILGLLLDIVQMLTRPEPPDPRKAMERIAAQQAEKQAAQAAMQAYTEKIHTYPANYQAGITPTGVDSEGNVVTTAADLFRPIALNINTSWQDLPFTAPVLCFVYLCGGAADTPLGVSESAYQHAVDVVCYERGDRGRTSGLGMPFAVRRAMWKLIKGVMAACTNPAEDTPIRHDGGRVLYPLLLDMAFRHFKWEGRTSRLPSHGFWDEELLRRLVMMNSPFVCEGRQAVVEGQVGTATWGSRVAAACDIVGNLTAGTGFLGQMMGRHLSFLRSEYYRTLSAKAAASRLAALARKDVLQSVNRPLLLRKLVTKANTRLMLRRIGPPAFAPLGPTSGERGIMAAAAGGGASMLLYSLLGLL